MIHLTWIEKLQELNSFDEELVGEGPAANIVIQSIISHEPPSAKLLPHCSLPFISNIFFSNVTILECITISLRYEFRFIKLNSKRIYF